MLLFRMASMMLLSSTPEWQLPKMGPLLWFKTMPPVTMFKSHRHVNLPSLIH